MRMRETLDAYRALTDRTLETIFAELDTSDILRDSMRYSVFAGGKRLRPALCMAACELLGGRAEDAALPACALEMIHAYSLIHDDLPALDNDDLRRGRPSNHIAFGEANAIIAGDGLQALAFRTVSGARDPKVLREVARGAFDMVTGQSYDLSAGDDEALLITIHRLKTGALIRAAVLSGAYCAAPSDEDILALGKFAEAYGLLFQITDDLLDAEGDAATLGKSVGKDAKEGKLTFVTLYGVDGAREKALSTAAAAKDALEPYGVRAAFFIELTDTTLTRKK